MLQPLGFVVCPQLQHPSWIVWAMGHGKKRKRVGRRYWALRNRKINKTKTGKFVSFFVAVLSKVAMAAAALMLSTSMLSATSFWLPIFSNLDAICKNLIEF
ncbi:hypothetical protein Drorol1_Dr00009412 [Drosera rotundifolia]